MKTEENNRMEALAYIIADLKAKNMELEQSMREITEKHNYVLRQLRGMEKHESNTEGYTLGELTEAFDKCEALEKEKKELKQQCAHLQMERDEAQSRADDCEHQRKELSKQIARFGNLEFKEIGVACLCRSLCPGGSPVKVGSTECVTCQHFLKMNKNFCVLCACCYDGIRAND